MEEIKIKIELFKYIELEDKAKERAYNEHLDFLSTIPYDYEIVDKKGNIIQKEDNILNWKEEDLKLYVEDSIKANEYLFFNDGEMANITHYTGKHKKTGITEFNFKGKIYKI